MKILKLKVIPFLILLFIPFGVFFNPPQTGGTISAATAVYWTPTNPKVGDVVTIQYNTTAGSLSSSITSLYLQWGFDFNGNYDPIFNRIPPVLPSKSWYPPNSVKGYNGFLLASPMTNISSEIWEISLTIQDDLPDRIHFYFSVNSNGADPRDGSQNNAWYIDPLFSTDGVFIIDPSVAETNFFKKTDSVTVTVRGNASATGWTVQLGGRSDSPLPCTVSSPTYDSTSGWWTLTVGLPTLIEVGLYDLIVSASVGANSWTDTEANAIQVVDSFKTEYTIALLGDQEMNAHPGTAWAIDGSLHDNTNFSSLLKELSIINADLFVNLGSTTFWGDIETMQQYNEYIELFYNLPHVYVASHRDRFLGSESDWEYTGGSIGALEKIVGIRHKQWMYGNHYFISIYTGDHRFRDQTELDWFSSTMGSASGNAKFLMIHDPIGYETNYNPTGQNAIDETGRQALAPIIKSGNIDYYIHSSAGVDGSQQVSETGAFHIGQAGALQGYRILKISGNEITEWDYTTNDELYPWGKVSITYSGTNDGTEETATGSITNNLVGDLSAARIVFQMKTGNNYESDVGQVYSQYDTGGVTHVEVLVPVSAGATKSVTVSKVSENTTTSETTTTTTADGGAPGFGLLLVISTVGTAVVIRRRKKI